jgi:uncharacterized protein YxjI
MKKQFLVIDVFDTPNYYIVDDLDSLINEMYEVDLLNGESFETVSKWFNNNHRVFEVNGEIKEMN